MLDSEQKLILEEIKAVLKSKKITYRQLAKGTDISESTLKKVFSGHDCSFSKIFQICSYLEIKLVDIAASITHKKDIHRFMFTMEQEEFFCENLIYYLFFNKMFRDEFSVVEARDFFGLSNTKLWSILKKLEEFKLLEVHQDDRIKFLVEGGLRFQKEGPLQKRILDKLSQSLVNNFVNGELQEDPVDSPFLRMNFGKLTPKTFSMFTSELREIDDKYRQIATRERKFEDKSNLIHVSWLFGISNCNGFDLIDFD